MPTYIEPSTYFHALDDSELRTFGRSSMSLLGLVHQDVLSLQDCTAYQAPSLQQEPHLPSCVRLAVATGLFL